MTHMAVVTGGISGLGAATASLLAHEGIDIVLDISDADAVRRAAIDIGPIDILVFRKITASQDEDIAS